MGFIEVGAGVGMVMSLTVLPLVAKNFGPSRAFLVISLLAALVLSGVLFGLASARPQGSKHERSKSMELFRSGQFWHLLAYHFLGMLATYAVIGWFPTYLRNDFGYSAVQAGFIGAMVSAALAVFSPVAGTISDRLGARTPVLLCGSLTSGICFTLFLLTKNPHLVLGAALLVGASMAFTIPVLMILVGERFATSGAGFAVSMAGTAGQISSSLSGPIFGYALQVTGAFNAVWGLALLCAFGRIPFLVWTRERKFHDANNE